MRFKVCCLMVMIWMLVVCMMLCCGWLGVFCIWRVLVWRCWVLCLVGVVMCWWMIIRILYVLVFML